MRRHAPRSRREACIRSTQELDDMKSLNRMMIWPLAASLALGRRARRIAGRRAGQGQGRRVSGQLVAALFRRAREGYFKEQNIEPEMIKLMGGPPNVAAMITNQIEVVGGAGHARRPQRQRQEARRGDVHRDQQPEPRSTRWSSSWSATASKAKTLADLKGAKLMSAPGPANLNTAKARSAPRSA